MDTRFHGYDIINPPVIPAQAGIQESTPASWIPVFTGMTSLTRLSFPRKRESRKHIRSMDTRFHGYDIINPPVIPAQAGIQESTSASWIPVFTGLPSLTRLSFPRKRESRKAHPHHGYPFSRVCHHKPACHSRASGNPGKHTRIMDTRFHGYDIINAPIIPAQAGIQESTFASWIPVFMGMSSLTHLSFPRKRESRKAHPHHGYLFSRV